MQRPATSTPRRGCDRRIGDIASTALAIVISFHLAGTVHAQESSPPPDDSPSMALRINSGAQQGAKVAADAGMGLKLGADLQDVRADLYRLGDEMRQIHGDLGAIETGDKAAADATRGAQTLRRFGKGAAAIGTGLEYLQAGSAMLDCANLPADQRDAATGGCGKLMEQGADKARYIAAGTLAGPLGYGAVAFVDTVVDPAYAKWVSDDGRTLRETVTADAIWPAIAPQLGYEKVDELGGEYADHENAMRARLAAVREQAREERERARYYEQQQLEQVATPVGPLLPNPDSFTTILQSYPIYAPSTSKSRAYTVPVTPNMSSKSSRCSRPHSGPGTDCPTCC